MAKQEKIKVTAREIFGKSYDEFLKSKHFFRVLKGGRASKKSTNVFREAIIRIMSHPNSNILVVRQTANTHETSTFAETQRAARRLGVFNEWKFSVNPCEATYKRTGQKIIYRGFDDPYKLTSLAVPVGVVCWVILEEAYEVDDVQAFLTLCEGIRGKEITDYGLWPQITLCYNPWVNNHFTKSMFWDVERPDTFRLTTTHWDNEWLTDEDHQRIEILNIKEIDGKPNPLYDPERYRVVGLGEYGIPGGAYFDEYRRDIHEVDRFPIPKDWRVYVSIDYGLDMFAAEAVAFDWHNKAYGFREIYKSGMVISDAAKHLKETFKDCDVRQYFAPPDLWNRQRETGASTAELFLQNGVVLTKASNNRIQGWYNLKEWLKPYTDEQGVKTASLVFLKGCCPNLTRCLPQLQCDYDPITQVGDPNDVADKPHELTHAPDAIRYMFAGRPRSGKEPVKEQHEKGSVEYLVAKQLEKMRKKRRTNNWNW